MKLYLIISIFLPTFIFSVKIEKIKEISTSKENGIIEIDQNYIITQISWAKTKDYKFDYLLGVFEASDDPSFKDGIPIAVIKEQGEFTEVNYLDVSMPKPSKYLRYIPPNANKTQIYPIKIYGYKIESSEELNEIKYYQVTNLPLISIHTENESQTGDNDINCFISIINDGKIEINENGVIKNRGRSSNFASVKKSFRIKFDSKQKILNFKGKEKRWTLIANHFDRSFLRNVLAFKISEIMQLKFTPRCSPVDVILNGNYQGNYYLCDKIEVGKNRVNITEIEPTDVTEPNISGGYLLEIDASSGFNPRYGHQGNSVELPANTFKTAKGIVGKIEFPEEDELVPEQKDYIVSKLNQFEDEVYNGILDSIDLESYSKYFLVEEFSGDPDNVFSSFYFTKERNDDKFYFGPVWDFDLGFDNDRRLIPTSEKPEFTLNYGDSAGTTREFVKTLIGNKNVIGYIKKTWDNLCATVLTEKVLIDFLDEKREYIKESAELDILKWDHYVATTSGNGRQGWGGGGMLGRKNENFEVSVEIIKDYVKNRFISLTKLINKAYTS
jgi:hypothetical protein